MILVQVDISQSKIDEIKKEYETKLDEYARLLDIRAARIKVCYHSPSILIYTISEVTDDHNKNFLQKRKKEISDIYR